MTHAAIRVSAAVVSLSLAFAGTAKAENAQPERKPVKVDITSMTTDFGNLHVLLLPVAVNLSTQTSLAAVASGHFQLNPNLMVSATAMFPYLGIDGKATDTKWFRLDAHVSLLRQSLVQEGEKITLSYNRETQTYYFRDVKVRETTTTTEYVTVPAWNMNGQGLNAGIMARSGLAQVKLDKNKDFLEKTTGKFFTAYVGIAALNAMGLSVNVDGYGGLSNYRWLTGGFDLMFDFARTYDVEPVESRTRFGGRLWAETIFARQYGLAGRLEIGYLPSGNGVFILAAFGGGLNLGL